MKQSIAFALSIARTCVNKGNPATIRWESANNWTIRQLYEHLSIAGNPIAIGVYQASKRSKETFVSSQVIGLDFDDLTETVVTLAHLSRFVIADLTTPSSIPHELMSFTRDLPSVPVQPIILREHRQYAMFEHLQRYQWVLPVHEYESQESLIAELNEKVIEPLEKKANEQKPKPL